MRYIQNQPEVIFISSMSPRTTAYMAFQQYFILKNNSQFICELTRAKPVVKGVSHYRPNINMFRRHAF